MKALPLMTGNILLVFAQLWGLGVVNRASTWGLWGRPKQCTSAREVLR